jgi:DnaJ family protein C protein 8
LLKRNSPGEGEPGSPTDLPLDRQLTPVYDAFRAQKIAYANEGAEAAKKESEVNQRKRKQEDEANWELRRDERVSNWRAYAGTSNNSNPSSSAPKQTKKKKLKVLG